MKNLSSIFDRHVEEQVLGRFGNDRWTNLRQAKTIGEILLTFNSNLLLICRLRIDNFQTLSTIINKETNSLFDGKEGEEENGPVME